MCYQFLITASQEDASWSDVLKRISKEDMQQVDVHFRQALSLLIDMNDQRSPPNLIRLAFKCSDNGIITQRRTMLIY